MLAPHPPPFPACMHPALGLLLRAQRYAANLGRPPWDFAVEIASLHDLGLTDTDLRWLVCRGYVSHAPEATRAGGRGRSFGPPGGLTFGKRTCVILTDAGVAAVQAGGEPGEPDGVAQLVPPAGGTKRGGACRPRWDRNARELRLGGRLVKQFRQPAGSQEAVLSAFEEEGWPPRIDDPLPPGSEQEPKLRLHATVRNLNRSHRARLLHFLACANGEAIGWRLLPSAGDARATPERRQSDR